VNCSGAEGRWYAVLQVRRERPDEELAIEVNLVVSLIPSQTEFSEEFLVFGTREEGKLVTVVRLGHWVGGVW
jgi:hypothetical protein